MSKLPPLSTEQFALVSEAFSEILSEGLHGSDAHDHIGARAAGDERVAAALHEMLAAHETEGSDEDPTGTFQASALEAVRVETRAAGEELERHVPEYIGPYRVVRFVALQASA